MADEGEYMNVLTDIGWKLDRMLDALNAIDIHTQPPRPSGY